MMRITREVRVEAIEDIRNYSSEVSTERNGHLIAKKGRQGWIDEWDSIVKKRFENNQISKERYEDYKCRSKELKRAMLKLEDI